MPFLCVTSRSLKSNLLDILIKVYGHIEAEEKLKAKMAKKEKNLTQIEMDVCVPDMG